MHHHWGPRQLAEVSVPWELPEILEEEKPETSFLAVTGEDKAQSDLGINQKCDPLKADYIHGTFVLVGVLNDYWAHFHDTRPLGTFPDLKPEQLTLH